MPNRASQPTAAAAPLPFDPRQALALFAQLADRIDTAGHAVELLERDLLPRSAAGAPYLVCGIVGPNNAGKSALFNALVGRDLSPSDPTGGATRRLVGAARSELIDRLRSNPHLNRFKLRAPASSNGVVAEALEAPDDPTDLVVVAESSLPPHIVLIDTPDFDSILAGNRTVSEALLAVADVVVVVVTRHSYQNRAVVEFFQEWLRHGRPWLLVYNEAVDSTIALAHAEKLVADIGSMPMAAYWAPHRIQIQKREESLAVQPLPLPAALPGVTGRTVDSIVDQPLRTVLLDGTRAEEIKSLAFAASLARLQGLARATAASLREDSARLADVRARAEAIALETGLAVASRAMPAGPFVEAFRVVLDRRTNVVSRSWRSLIRGVRVGLERFPNWIRGRGDAVAAATAKLDEVERDMLGKQWPEFWEQLVRDLGTEARADVRRRSGADVAAALDADLARPDADVMATVSARLRATQTDLGGFQHACEELIDDAIEARGFDLDIQAAADIATMVPIAFAAVVIFTTTGVGADIAAAGGGAVSTFLMEKYSHLLGSGITKAARKRWTEMRGREMAEVLFAVALPQTAAVLAARTRADADAVAELERLAGGQQ